MSESVITSTYCDAVSNCFKVYKTEAAESIEPGDVLVYPINDANQVQSSENIEHAGTEFLVRAVRVETSKVRSGRDEVLVVVEREPGCERWIDYSTKFLIDKGRVPCDYSEVEYDVNFGGTNVDPKLHTHIVLKEWYGQPGEGYWDHPARRGVIRQRKDPRLDTIVTYEPGEVVIYRGSLRISAPWYKRLYYQLQYQIQRLLK